MLGDSDKQRLQAGFDGELTPTEWRRVQEEFRGNAEAQAWLAELAHLRSTLDAVPEVPVPKDLAAAIKVRIPEAAIKERSERKESTVRHVDFAARRRPLRPLVGGLALAASLVMAVGIGVQFWGVSELGMDSQLRSRMTGTLFDAAAPEAQQHWQWPGMDARALLVRDNSELALELELDAQTAAELVLSLDGEQWRWRQDAAGASEMQQASGSDESVLRLAVAGEQRYRLMLEPYTRDGGSAQGTPPTPQVHLRLERDGQSIHRGTIGPD
ncbi:hypothetical protein FV139_10785 [Parahaliea maris]|uniref:Anti-sigma-K factor RskA n=1 Tax=Parahaliea maris TaxID=2716870 RepID=A0A5C8ZZS1_9GAMM|nr:hypothetical protein [Parahaliea maris]TXS94085.1 hypothetical protein FV139_10785 [Parahaliea maris]